MLEGPRATHTLWKWTYLSHFEPTLITQEAVKSWPLKWTLETHWVLQNNTFEGKLPGNFLTLFVFSTYIGTVDSKMLYPMFLISILYTCTRLSSVYCKLVFYLDYLSLQDASMLLVQELLKRGVDTKDQLRKEDQASIAEENLQRKIQV